MFFKGVSKAGFRVVFALFLLALGLRLLFLFFVAGLEYCGWYHDSYHHWQIAYYTLHVGLKQNPPRMWDLNGQEYFWGLLPTLTESLLLWVFNTASIVPFRVFNSVMGSLSVCLIYLLGRKYFDRQIGLFSALLAAFCPILWEVDTSGMLDPMGVTCLLLALLLYDKGPFAAGLFLGLASLSHIEFWFLALGVMGCYIVFEKSGTDFVPAVLGWLVPMAPYFYFLYTRTETHDLLYALRYNYLASVTGEWLDISLPLEAQIWPRSVAVGFLILSLAVLLYLLRRRPRDYIIHSFFWGFIAMQGVIFGLTAYIVPYLAMGQVPRLLIDRLFALNYYYISLLTALTLRRFSLKLKFSSMRLSFRSISLQRDYLFLLLTILVYLLSLPFVTQQYFNTVYSSPYEKQVRTADWITLNYEGGSVVSSLVIMNYRLINRGVPYAKVFGSLYSPRYYGSENTTDSYLWLKNLNATWVIVDKNIIENFPFLKNYPVHHPPFHAVDQVKPPEYEFLYYVNKTELASVLSEEKG